MYTHMHTTHTKCINTLLHTPVAILNNYMHVGLWQCTLDLKFVTIVIADTLYSCREYIIILASTLLSSLSIGMHKQLESPQQSIHGVNRKVNAPAVL